jgi:hypothetical protein
MHFLRATLPLVCPAVQPVHITFDVTCVYASYVDEVAGWEDSALAAVHAVKHDGNVVRFVEGTWSDPAVKGLAVSTTSPADGVLQAKLGPGANGRHSLVGCCGVLVTMISADLDACMRWS